MAQPFDILKADLEKIQKEILEELAELLRGLNIADNKVQVMNLLSEIDLDSYLDEKGFTKAVQKYLDSLVDVAAISVGKYGPGTKLTDLINEVELVKNSVSEYLLGSAESYTGLLRLNIQQGIMGTLSDAQIIENLQSVGLTNTQLNTAIETAYRNHERNVVMEIFDGEENQRFEYVGDIIETSSDICQWLMENQNEEGYTLEEIREGINTPFGVVNEHGRIPNFNCGHIWLPKWN